MNSYKQSVYIIIIRVCANLLMLGALFLGMFQASRWITWPSEAVFCIFFFGITIPVWIIAHLLVKWTRSRFPAEPESFVHLPGQGDILVRWRVVIPDDKKCLLTR